MKNYYLVAYLLGIGILVLTLNPTSRFASDKLSLEFNFNEKQELVEDIVLINSMDFPLDTIQKWTRRILTLKPKVLAVDIYYDSTSNLKKDTLDATIILPAFSENGADVQYTLNYFSNDQHYGSVEHYDDVRLRKNFDYNGVTIPSFPLQIVKQFDSSFYELAVSRSNDEIINFSNINMVVDYPDDYTDDELEPLVKDKIVIIGYLGHNLNHKPSAIFDDKDVHSTSVGDMYGTKIIASEVHTLLGNHIDELGNAWTWIVSIVVMIGVFTGLIFLRIGNKIILILTGNLVMIGLVFGVISLSFWILLEHNYFISPGLISSAIFFGTQGGVVFQLAKS